jgi:hypothetical protein
MATRLSTSILDSQAIEPIVASRRAPLGRAAQGHVQVPEEPAPPGRGGGLTIEEA